MTDSYSFKFEDSEASVALKNRQFSSLDSYEARLSLFNLSILADYDQLVCLPELANIDKHWYQIKTAKKVIKQFGGRAMLSDELGLGKTIEAAMICKEYLLRNQIKSLLILTPATQTYLSESLKASKIEHSQFRGDMSLIAKDTAIADFRERVPVMLATETGGEGRNLQFAIAGLNPVSALAVAYRRYRFYINPKLPIAFHKLRRR